MKKKDIEKILRLAYRAGQESVSYLRLINEGKGKPDHLTWCDNEPCKHKIKEETSSAEDEVIEKLMS